MYKSGTRHNGRYIIDDQEAGDLGCRKMRRKLLRKRW
jgi:hypothetical protein